MNQTTDSTVLNSTDVVARPKGGLGIVPGLMVWLPIAAVAVGAIGLWHFVYYAFSTNLVLNGLILTVALWGAWTMISHVRLAYREDRVFAAGMDWLRKGQWSDESNPKLGGHTFVAGMLGRLEKLGLGHNISMQSAVTEPEIEALKHHFEQKQDLSQFLVGLMVGLGLLGTFVGLLETLVATSELIGSIANSVGGGAGNMETEFAKIVGGLKAPLEKMGTAFSASMFGLIGSIMLGFQMVIVKRTCTAVVDHVRDEVLSLAEKAEGAGNVEITERFLATLLADMMEQHRQSGQVLASVVDRLADFAPRFEHAVQAQETMAQRMDVHEATLAQTVQAVSQVQQIIPVMSQLATHSSSLLNDTAQTRFGLESVIRQMPDLQTIQGDLVMALNAIEELGEGIRQTRELTSGLDEQIRKQAATIDRTSELALGLDLEVKRQGEVSARLEGALTLAEQERLNSLVLKPGMGQALKSKLRRMLDKDKDAQDARDGSDDDQRNVS